MHVSDVQSCFHPLVIAWEVPITSQGFGGSACLFALYETETKVCGMKSLDYH